MAGEDRFLPGVFAGSKEAAILVLTRKVHERIMIGPDIVITVVDIDRGKVRIGIDAPKSVEIQREELIGKARVKHDQD